MRQLSLALPLLATAAILTVSAPAWCEPVEGRGAAMATAPSATGTLRPLPATGNGFVMSGEQSRATFPIFLSEAEAASGVNLVLALESAVSVMPEASRLAVFVGGAEVGTLVLGGRKATRSVALEPSVLSAGWNRVKLVATQRHRVDCSLQGVYELWTKIDNAASGISLAAPSEAPALQRARLDASGTLAIRIRTANREAKTVSAAFALAGQAARAAGVGAARVEFAAEPASGAAATHGIDLFYGSDAELNLLAVPPAVIAASAGAPQLSAPAGASGPLMLVVGKGSASSNPSTTFLEPTGNANDSVKPLVLDDVTISLADLGVASSRFTGRDFRETIELSLPADALVADYDSVVLRLDAAYAAGLADGGGLNISVNDALTATLPFGRQAGEVFAQRPIELPLSAFRPGANRIEIEAIVRSEADEACTAQTQISGAPRFLLLDSSTLAVPRLARMARVPELSATFGSQGGTAPGSKTQRLVLASFDADTLAAAGTFVVRQSIVSAAMPRFEVSDLPLTDRGGAIVFGRAADLGDIVPALSGIDRTAHETLRDRPADLAAMSRSGRPDLDPTLTGSIAVPVVEGMSNAAQLLAEWQSSLPVGGSTDSILGTLGSAFAGISDVFATRQTQVPLPVDARTTLLVAQSLPPGWTAPLTVVTAASGADLNAGMVRLAHPDLWKKATGRAVVVSGSDILSVEAGAVALIATTTPSFANLRLVAAAWLSLNPAMHAILLLASTLLFGGITTLWLRHGGRKDPSNAAA